MKKKLSLFLFVALVVLFSGLHPVAAQGESAEQKPDSTAAEAPQPIPVQNLIGKIEEAADEIALTRKRIQLKDDVISLDTLFPEYVDFIGEQKKATESFIKSNPNRQKINNQIKKWKGYDDHLTQWETQVNEYEERNIKLLEGVKINERIWELTYQQTSEQEIPAEVIRRVGETRQAFTDLHREIVQENNDYLLLESRINKQKVEISEVVETLDKLKSSEVYDLFYLRHEPLWEVDWGTLTGGSDRSDTGTAFEGNLVEIIKYLKDNRSSIYRYLVFVLLVVLLIRWLRRSYEKYGFKVTNKNLIHARDIIVRYSRQAMLFLAVFGSTFYLENRPTLLSDLLILVVLLASIPLVRPFMRKEFKNLLYFVVLIYVLDSAKTYIWFTSLQYRLYLMMEALLVILLLYRYAFRQLTKLRFEEHYFGALLIRIAPFLQIVALVSIVSNALGYTNLADLTLKISTKSGVYALIFYALLLVLGGITTGLIHQHYMSRESSSAMDGENAQLKALKIIRVITFFLWLLIFLNIVDLLSPLTDYLKDVLTEPYIFGSLSITLGDVLMFLLILSTSFLITSLVSFLFDSGQFSLKYLKLPKGIPAAISLVIRYFIIAAGIILALSSLGVDLSKFNLMAGALGLGIGFGLQNVISNFVSGLILVFERPILVGDTIEVNNLMGTVNRIGVRSSNISTFDGAEVVVPNSNLISNDLINWTLSSNIKRVEVLVGVSYGTDLNEVLKLLLEVVNESEIVLKDPKPQALFSEFGDSSLNFRLRFWVPFEMGLQSKSDISVAVYNKFKENNIEIPFPQRDVHIRTIPPETKSGDQD